MMYQRDIVVTLLTPLPGPLPSTGEGGIRLMEEAQQLPDDGRKDRVGAEEEECKDRRHDHDHDAGRDRLLAGRPMDLARFDADLTDEFAGGDFRQFPASSRVADRKAPRGPSLG